MLTWILHLLCSTQSTGIAISLVKVGYRCHCRDQLNLKCSIETLIEKIKR